jgi:hypothetical protein
MAGMRWLRHPCIDRNLSQDRTTSQRILHLWPSSNLQLLSLFPPSLKIPESAGNHGYPPLWPG